jgi:hypothetical protein
LIFDPQDPDSRAEAVSHMASNSPRKFIRKSPKSPSAVSMRPRKPTLFFLIEPPFNIIFSSNYAMSSYVFFVFTKAVPGSNPATPQSPERVQDI